MESEASLLDLERPSWDSLSPVLSFRSLLPGDKEIVDRSSSPLGGGGAPNLKMWTVSVAEDRQRRVDVALKDML